VNHDDHDEMQIAEAAFEACIKNTYCLQSAESLSAHGLSKKNMLRLKDRGDCKTQRAKTDHHEQSTSKYNMLSNLVLNFTEPSHFQL